MDIDIAEDIIRKALTRGCDAAEVFMKNAKGLSVEVKGGEVEALEAAMDYGIAVRVIRNRRPGFAFTNSPEDLGAAIDKAVMSAGWTSEDEYVDLPGHESWKEVLIFDEKIKNIKEDDVIKDAMLLEESAIAFDKRIKKVRKAEVSAGTASTTIVNSKGVTVSYESTYYSAHVTTLAQDDSGEGQMGWDFAGSRRLSDINVASVGKTAAGRAVGLLGSRKIASVKAPVILSPSVAVDFLEILSASISAEAVQKKRSFLIDKIGRKVMSGLVDIIDDGLMQWGTGTKPADDEGVSVTKKEIVSGGVLNGFIHNTYTAKKAGVKSTGNAVRGSYKGLPGVGVTNFYIKPANIRESVAGAGFKPALAESDRGDNKLVKSLSRGILVLGAMGVHTANPVSGDFSIGISGLWIEKGEALYPVKEAVISGNVLDMFRKVEAVGSDLTFYGKVGSPSILIGDMDISA
ncbi:MAG: TldD/PmbA family protein [Nitrospirae bacterium]|nr:TldD/PmbA family protein [Nitrospirota bacterium]